jgi:hypothetical protein
MSIALVLSGGGSKGDFELGAIRYLYEVKGVRPTLISAASVGSINAAKLAEGEVSPASGLGGLASTWYTLDTSDDMWTFEPWVRNAPPEVSQTIVSAANTHLFSRLLPGSPSLLPADNVGAGGFRDLVNFVSIFSFLIGAALQYGPTIAAAAEASSIANLNPIRDRLFGRNGFPAIFDSGLVANWAAAGNSLRLGTVSLDTGALRFVSESGQLLDRRQQPVTDAATHQPIFCDVREAVMASSAIGVVFPPVKLGSEYYVDGGHRSVLPVDPILAPLFDIKTAFLVSASTIGVTKTSFEQRTTLGNIAVRALFETFIAEIVGSETSPRGGWGTLDTTLIAPTLEVHGLITVDPGLVRINSDYGWMRADDAVSGRNPGDRLFELSDDITWQRAQIWFNEGRYLGSFPVDSLGEYSNLPNYRADLQKLLDERRALGGSLPPGVDRWAQIGEAHSVGSGSRPLLNVWPSEGASIALGVSKDEKPILVLLDSRVGDTSSEYRNKEFNDSYQVIYSTSHQDPLIAGTVGWRVAGRSKLSANAAISCVQTDPGATLLLAADQDGTVVRAESVPDGHGYTGWLPLNDLRTAAGGRVTGVSRFPGSFDVFAIGIDGNPRTAARHPGDPNWGGWWPLPAGPFIAGAGITAVSPSRDRLDIFSADATGKILTAAWNPIVGWTGWSQISVGSTSPGGAIAVISCAPNELDVFVVGTDGFVYRTMSSRLRRPLSARTWAPWTLLGSAGSGFYVGSKVGIASPNSDQIVIALSDLAGSIFAGSLTLPSRTFSGFSKIGTLTFAPSPYVNLVACDGGKVHAYVIGSDRCVYRAILGADSLSSWSEWERISASESVPTAIPGMNAPFLDGTTYHTSDTVDEIEVSVQEYATAPDRVEFVLKAGPGIDWYKALKLGAGPSGRAEWSDWESLGGMLTSEPAATLNAPGGLVVFARGTDNAMWHTWQNQINGDWSPWSSLGGAFTSGPAAALYQDGRLNVFGRGTDNAIWTKWQTTPNGDWSDWESLGGALTSNPAATLNAPGGLVVFARGTNNAIWYSWQDRMNDDWSAWTALGGDLTSGPAAALYRDGRLNVFAQRSDGAMWTQWQGTRKPGGWTISVVNNRNVDSNWVYSDQLRGATITFIKAKEVGTATSVSQVPIDNVTPGSLITFKWVRDH